MKRTIILLFFLPLLTFAQKNRHCLEENNEVYLQEDNSWISKLNQNENLEENNIDNNVKINIFEQRFKMLNLHTELNISYNSVTYDYVRKYLSYRWYGKVIGLSSYYFPLFKSVLSKYGLPKELKYLAVVESALNPRAASWAGAPGLWQFMPSTGKQYGLYKNSYYNDFYDPVKNTIAAAKYLKYLYNIFHDWNFAISAYNCGPGNVNSAIRKAGTRNYWMVRKYLPKETQAYVPSFVAVNYMFNFYKEHGFRPMYFKYSFYNLKKVRNNKPTRMDLIEGNKKLIQFANPQFTSNIIPANSIIYLPK